MMVSQEIQRHLDPGERLLWSGRPRQGLLLRAADTFLIPFSLLWCGFAIFWEWQVFNSRNSPLFFLVFGGFFVAIGLYFVFGRFIFEAKQRAKTFYGVTDQRVVIVRGLFQKNTKSLSLRTLTDVTLTERSSGEGTITFGPTSSFSAFGGSFAWPGMSVAQTPQFEGIPQAKSVYNIIRDAQRKT